ncbi:MAG TPA: hypothetical protein VM425_06085 [Myxococcota bacterium]|nr:hypothetical protein [Myxococcota bacterium]
MIRLRKRVYALCGSIALGCLQLSGCGGGDGNGDECADHQGDFCVASADHALADSYNKSFDWSTDKIALRYLTGPTRCEAEKALYFRNPGIYKNTSSEPHITPDPLPTLDPAPAGFDFALSDLAPNQGQQLLDNTSIVDSLAETPITAAEQSNAPLWLPAVMVYLAVDWDSSKILNLYYGYNAVKGQKWGVDGATLPPQTIQHIYLHSGEIWLEIVFENYVDLGAGISDSDGDGYKEIYGKIDPAHFTSEVFDQLVNAYVTPKLSVADLNSLIDNKILDDLYSDFDMRPASGLGEAFTSSGIGTFQYPFKVIQGVSPKDDIFIVLLVEP